MEEGDLAEDRAGRAPAAPPLTGGNDFSEGSLDLAAGRAESDEGKEDGEMTAGGGAAVSSSSTLISSSSSASDCAVLLDETEDDVLLRVVEAEERE